MNEQHLNDMTMDEIMRRWPTTVRIVLRNHLPCVGCPIASFHTFGDAVREHRIDEEKFRRELLAAIECR